MKRAILISILAAVTVQSYAQSIPAESLPSCPDAIVCGSLAAGDSPFAAGENMSAGVFNDNRISIGASFMPWAPKSSTIYSPNLGASFLLGKFALGGQVKYNSGEKYTIYNSDWQENGTFSPYDIHAILGTAYRITDNLSAGVSLRYSHSEIADGFDASCFSADLSISWRTEKISVSAAACNFGTAVKYVSDGSTGRLPQLLKGGASYSALPFLTLSAEADYLLDNSKIMFCGGAKAKFLKVVEAKAGYHYGGKGALIPSYFSAGLGFRLGAFAIDGVFIGGSETLGNSCCLSLSCLIK